MDKKKENNKDKLIQPINMSFSVALEKVINNSKIVANKVAIKSLKTKQIKD